MKYYHQQAVFTLNVVPYYFKKSIKLLHIFICKLCSISHLTYFITNNQKYIVRFLWTEMQFNTNKKYSLGIISLVIPFNTVNIYHLIKINSSEHILKMPFQRTRKLSYAKTRDKMRLNSFIIRLIPWFLFLFMYNPNSSKISHDRTNSEEINSAFRLLISFAEDTKSL